MKFGGAANTARWVHDTREARCLRRFQPPNHPFAVSAPYAISSARWADLRQHDRLPVITMTQPRTDYSADMLAKIRPTAPKNARMELETAKGWLGGGEGGVGEVSSARDSRSRIVKYIAHGCP